MRYGAHPDWTAFYVDQRCSTRRPFLLLCAAPEDVARPVEAPPERRAELPAWRRTGPRNVYASRVLNAFSRRPSAEDPARRRRPGRRVPRVARSTPRPKCPSGATLRPNPRETETSSASSLKQKTGSLLWPPMVSVKISVRLVSRLAISQNGAGAMSLPEMLLPSALLSARDLWPALRPVAMLPARRSCHLGEQDPDEAPREQREANPYQQGVGAPFPARPTDLCGDF